MIQVEDEGGESGLKQVSLWTKARGEGLDFGLLGGRVVCSFVTSGLVLGSSSSRRRGGHSRSYRRHSVRPHHEVRERVLPQAGCVRAGCNGVLGQFFHGFLAIRALLHT